MYAKPSNKGPVRRARSASKLFKKCGAPVLAACAVAIGLLLQAPAAAAGKDYRLSGPYSAEQSRCLSDSPRGPKRRSRADHPRRGDEAGLRESRRNRQRQPPHGSQSGRPRGLHPVGRHRQGRQAGPRPAHQPDRPPELGLHSHRRLLRGAGPMGPARPGGREPFFGVRVPHALEGRQDRDHEKHGAREYSRSRSNRELGGEDGLD